MKILLSFVNVSTNILSNRKGKNYYETHLKNGFQKIENIEFSNGRTIFSEVTHLRKMEDYSGLGSSHLLKTSLLEWLVSFSQMCQLLSYNHDGMSREDSETLWMRSVKGTLRDTVNIPENPVIVVGEITQSKKLKKENDVWRLLEMQGETLDKEVFFQAKVAHQLPIKSEKEKDDYIA